MNQSVVKAHATLLKTTKVLTPRTKKNKVFMVSRNLGVAPEINLRKD
ncbi:MAG: hypothetical protein HC916_00755 [Coleofasciculaceae cyanobacterium SM2_1_6]|nr:hypothetical protein [Coleofasciculaceae cyanobacterium SM2_1_6]